jgi:hypothetical protein
LNLYVGLLDQAITAASSQSASRLQWDVVEPLLSPGDAAARARAALAALTASLGAAGAALVVRTVNGVHAFSVGDADVFSVPYEWGGADQIMTTRSIFGRYSMTLASRRAEGEAFTRREHRLLDLVAPIFATWLSNTLRRQTSRGDSGGRADDCIGRLGAGAIGLLRPSRETARSGDMT